MPEVSIIIVSYNTKELLKQCLVSVVSTKHLTPDTEIIVVDNASKDGSPEMVERNFPAVGLIRSKKNLGFSGGNNLGLRHAKGEYILFLNSDTIVKKGAIEKLVKFMEIHPEAGVAGPKLLNQDNTLQPSVGNFPTLPVVVTMLFKEHFGGSAYVRGSFAKTKEVDWVMGAALMVRREVVRKTSGFDENIFMYYDEVEWCYRIKKAGFRIYFYPAAEIIHLWQKSSTSGREAPILANFKSLIYFYKKHRSKPELVILRTLLRMKAGLAWLWGAFTNNSYLKNTYAKAFQIS